MMEVFFLVTLLSGVVLLLAVMCDVLFDWPFS